MRANERTDERVTQYLRLYSCLFQTTVDSFHHPQRQHLHSRPSSSFLPPSQHHHPHLPYPGYNPDELVIKVRIEAHPDPDFIEVELPRGPGRKYWATRSSVRSFARTAHSFAGSGLLASLAPSAVLTRSLAPLTSLTPSLVGQ